MKEKRKLAWLLALLGILAVVNYYFRPFASGASVPQAVTGADSGDAGWTIPDATFDTALLEPQNRMGSGEVTRNIFEYEQGRPESVIRGTPKQTSEPPRPSAPAPPPKPPLQFFGFAESSSSDQQRVFLTDGENIFVARQGELVLERFRVVGVDQKSVQIEDTRGQQRWVLPLQQP